jgi:ribosomal protein S12 methylthiotransferase
MKIGMISLGCPKNLVDSEVMLGLAQEQGHQLTRHAAEADVLIVNTCAFIDKAKQESIDTILEMAEHKKTGACRRLVVTGCMAERYRDELRAQIPEIDAVLGTGEVPEIVNAIANCGFKNQDPPYGSSAVIPLLRANGEPVITGPPEPSRTLHATASLAEAAGEGGLLPTYLYDASTPRLLATPRHYAYVKIAEGCDYRCAFCIIPTLRGKYRSRSQESIVAEAERLASQGVKELLLISQDTSFYGIDRGERGALSRLLRALNRVEGLEWVRMLYLYPTTITDERLLDRIRTRVPGVTLRTTFIVGFPGETSDDYAELQSFVKTVGFDHMGVFTYSHEEGTTAHRLDDDVPAAVKRKRQNGLMALQRRIVAQAQRSRIGSQVRVLVDGPSAEHDLVLRGRLQGQAPEIDPQVYLTDCDPSAITPGQFLDAEVVGSRAYDLIVRPCLH